MAEVVGIQRFPIKGLSAETLDKVTLKPGQGIPGDRLFGFARHGSGFDPAHPIPIAKDKFVVLLTQARLAGLSTVFDALQRRLRVTSPTETITFDLADAGGQRDAGLWLAEYLQLPDDEPPTFVHASPHRFTDVSVVSPKLMNAVSILNLASLRALSTRLGVEIEAERFRANVVIDGLPAWWELENVGGRLCCGDVEFEILQRTRRCAATEVNPTTSKRDINLPYELRKNFGHMDMGAYAQTLVGGTLSLGMSVSVTEG